MRWRWLFYSEPWIFFTFHLTTTCFLNETKYQTNAMDYCDTEKLFTSLVSKDDVGKV